MVMRLLRRCAAPGAAVLLGSILLAGCDSASGSKESAAGESAKASPRLERINESKVKDVKVKTKG
jgi:hypothetical protein